MTDFSRPKDYNAAGSSVITRTDWLAQVTPARSEPQRKMHRLVAACLVPMKRSYSRLQICNVMNRVRY